MYSSGGRFLKIVAGVIIVVLVLALIQFFRPVPSPVFQQTVPVNEVVPGHTNIAFPSSTQAAVWAEGPGLMGTYGAQTPTPIASLTKMMTAYLVLKAHPLGVGETGPTLTITAQDVQTYKADVANGDSFLPVAQGEKLTEFQLLQGLLLPSGDNVASLLGTWVSGSVGQFVTLMNQTARQLGMNHTHYADTSGVSPATVSTASDQIKIAAADMQNPVFRSIVAMPQATLPVSGTIYNVDAMIGKQGIIGIKTGSTPQAGGCFASAMEKQVGGHQVLVIGVILGEGGVQPLDNVLNSSVSMLHSAENNLEVVHLSGGSVGQITAPWSSAVSVGTKQSISTVGYPGMKVQVKAQVDKLSPQLSSGQQVGTVSFLAGGKALKMPVYAKQSLSAPSVTWRLVR